MFGGGFYTAYVRDNEIHSSPLRYENSNDNPVSTAGVATGFPFVTISINDNELIKKGDVIEVVWEDGKETTESLNNRSAIIIPYANKPQKNNKSMRKVIILNKEGNIIYETA